METNKKVTIRIGDQVIECAEPAPISECSKDSMGWDKLLTEREVGELLTPFLNALSAKLNLPAGKYSIEFELGEPEK